MSSMVELGARLSELRENMGLSQSQVAEYLDIDQSLLSRIEKGERSITVSSLERLADLYCLPAEELAYGTENISHYELAFRAKSFTPDDFMTLAKINRIILNQQYMDTL